MRGRRPRAEQFLHGGYGTRATSALVFQVKQCRNCHSLGESGGQRGPALDSVAVRLTQDQLIRQVNPGAQYAAYGRI